VGDEPPKKRNSFDLKHGSPRSQGGEFVVRVTSWVCGDPHSKELKIDTTDSCLHKPPHNEQITKHPAL